MRIGGPAGFGIPLLAGKRIVKLNFGKRDDPVLTILRRVLRDARAVAKQQGATVRIKLR